MTWNVRRWCWVLGFVFACGKDGDTSDGAGTSDPGESSDSEPTASGETQGAGLGEGEPCTDTSECAEGLYCDFHGGTGVCDWGHDHEPDCDLRPEACGFSSSGDGSTDTTTTSDDTGAEIACGDASCESDMVCVEDVFAPACTPIDENNPRCGEGQTRTQCGGIGFACCCDPPPPPEYRCVSARSCDGPPTCDCLGMICERGNDCTALTGEEAQFRCEPLPQP